METDVDPNQLKMTVDNLNDNIRMLRILFATQSQHQQFKRLYPKKAYMQEPLNMKLVLENLKHEQQEIERETE